MKTDSGHSEPGHDGVIFESAHYVNRIGGPIVVVPKTQARLTAFRTSIRGDSTGEVVMEYVSLDFEYDDDGFPRVFTFAPERGSPQYWESVLADQIDLPELSTRFRDTFPQAVSVDGVPAVTQLVVGGCGFSVLHSAPTYCIAYLGRTAPLRLDLSTATGPIPVS